MNEEVITIFDDERMQYIMDMLKERERTKVDKLVRDECAETRGAIKELRFFLNLKETLKNS